MALGLIDIGGTTIKFGVWEESEITKCTSIKTPNNLNDFYKVLSKQINKYKNEFKITGVGISSPGAVDQESGMIGGASAVPYIHNFKIVHELEQIFELPVTIENDANCAALAEVKYGAAVGENNVVLLIIGSGVGGSIIINGQVYRGAHLLGGEFGYMLSNDTETVSNVGTAVEMAKKYNIKENPKIKKDGKMIFESAQQGDQLAQQYLNNLFDGIAKTIFNLQYSIDPDLFLLGGGISENPILVPGIERAMDKIMSNVKIAKVRPEIKTCKFKSEANLIGAAVNMEGNKYDQI
jgi:predicted NBD/HSP70 family sugar kinase